MAETPNLKLTTTSASESDKLFIDWRVENSGDQESSNLMKIDRAFGVLDERLYKKVDAENGKGLSQNDYSNDEKSKVASTESTVNAHVKDSNIHTSLLEKNAWNNKVDAIQGKGLSSNDYTDQEKDKLSQTQQNIETHISDKEVHLSHEEKEKIISTAGELQSHIKDYDMHTELTEKTTWDAKESPEGAQAKADAALAAAKQYADEKEASWNDKLDANKIQLTTIAPDPGDPSPYTDGTILFVYDE